MIEKINLFGGLNLNPIPLEFHQGMSTTKQLLALQSSLNTIITNINNMLTVNNSYTDEQIELISTLLNGSNTLDGKFLKKESVTLDKITNESISALHDNIMSYIGDIMKFVTFGLDSNGHFIANVPESWNSINFSTNSDGNLILDIKF